MLGKDIYISCHKDHAKHIEHDLCERWQETDCINNKHTVVDNYLYFTIQDTFEDADSIGLIHEMSLNHPFPVYLQECLNDRAHSVWKAVDGDLFQIV